MAEERSKIYKIAVGLDGSDSSWKALEEAVKQAAAKEAELHIVSIQESVDASYSASEVLAADKTSRERLERAQIKARTLAEKAGVKTFTEITPGSSTAAMTDFVKKNSMDMLVIGDTGHSSIWGALLGTSAEKIVRNARCSVLIVR
jgi:nucleotide-binding universal stress UspA family protein